MSTIVTDTITGKSTATTITIGSTPVVSASANSMTIRGEGSNQTSIQQGLAKVWCSIDQDSSGHPVYDSFNVASTSDIGTGKTPISFTNNMANDDYADILNGSGQNEGGMSGGNFSVTNHVTNGQKTTSQVCTDVRDSNGDAKDNHDARVTVHGDLA